MSVSRLLGATMVAGASGFDEDGAHHPAQAPASAQPRDTHEALLVRRVRRLIHSRRSARARAAVGGAGRRL
jgi:hypothetical protein